MRIAAALVAIGFMANALPAHAGFRTPESLVRNVLAYYGNGDPELSHGLPRDEATAQQFFDGPLRRVWTDPAPRPFDFIAQATSWKLGPFAITDTIRQYDRTYLRVAFTNRGRPIALNFVAVKSPEGWRLADIESTHDSLSSFLARLTPTDSRRRAAN